MSNLPLESASSEDMALVRAVVSGSIPHWHEFVARYTGLMLSVIRRHVFSEEDVRTVYVLTLEKLYKKDLGTFQGRSALSTWLAQVTRNETLDFVRRSRGRTNNSQTVNRLSSRDRKIFKLFFEEGLPLGEVHKQLIQEMKNPPSPPELALAVAQNEARVDRRIMKRLEAQRRARNLGLTSHRLVGFLDELVVDQNSARWKQSPEFQIMEKEARRRTEEILAVVGELSSEDRKLLAMRYEQGLSAGQAAKELGLDGPRRAYKLLERCKNRLRKLIENRGLVP